MKKKTKKQKKTEEIKYFDTQQDEKLNIQNGINQHTECVYVWREGGGVEGAGLQDPRSIFKRRRSPP